MRRIDHEGEIDSYPLLRFDLRLILEENIAIARRATNRTGASVLSASLGVHVLSDVTKLALAVALDNRGDDIVRAVASSIPISIRCVHVMDAPAFSSIKNKGSGDSVPFSM
mmetsp:Transcript_4369/g.9500  ORF Transcript_4369/g.9500 Transcript_4369/m.9500 type:complete len:111 (+) Transcript_4369:73-405(+)